MSLWLQVYKDKYENISVAEIEEFLNSGFKKKHISINAHLCLL